MSLALHYWMRGAHHCSVPPVSEMTYTVSSGTLNSTIPYTITSDSLNSAKYISTSFATTADGSQQMQPLRGDPKTTGNWTCHEPTAWPLTQRHWDCLWNLLLFGVILLLLLYSLIPRISLSSSSVFIKTTCQTHVLTWLAVSSNSKSRAGKDVFRGSLVRMPTNNSSSNNNSSWFFTSALLNVYNWTRR